MLHFTVVVWLRCCNAVDYLFVHCCRHSAVGCWRSCFAVFVLELWSISARSASSVTSLPVSAVTSNASVVSRLQGRLHGRHRQSTGNWRLSAVLYISTAIAHCYFRRILKKNMLVLVIWLLCGFESISHSVELMLPGNSWHLDWCVHCWTSVILHKHQHVAHSWLNDLIQLRSVTFVCFVTDN